MTHFPWILQIQIVFHLLNFDMTITVKIQHTKITGVLMMK